MKKYYAVVDTNVIVSGLITNNPASPTKGVMDYLTDYTIVPLYCDEILKEYQEVLNRDKFHLPETKIKEILELIKSDGLSLRRTASKKQFPDPKDVVFYEVALSKEDSFLVTGNIKHFPEVDFVVTPAEMMTIIEEDL